MGWLRELPSGHWRACWRDPDGATQAKTFRIKTDARNFLTTVEGAKLTGTHVDPKAGREKLSAFWVRWLARAVETGKPTERTRIAYEEIWRLYLLEPLGKRPLNAITRADCRAVVDAAAERSAWRARDVLKVLRMLLNRAMDEEMIGRNPAARIAVPAIDLEEPWVLTPEEVDCLADSVGERWRAFVLLAAYGSLRWSELVALKAPRVDLLRRRIRIEEKITEHGRLIQGEPKTRQSRRAVAIPDFVAREIAEHMKRYPPGLDGLIFTAPEGGPVRRPHFGRLVWRPATKRAELSGFPFKNLRHTGASLAIAAGANPLLLAARLGHTSTRMVERHYVSLFEGLDREIGEQLGTMHRRRRSESKRLRPQSGQTAAHVRHIRGRAVVPLRAAEGKS